MTGHTPETAAALLCPLSRTFAAPTAESHCRGAGCAVWRWLPIPADHPAFVAAVAKLKDGDALKHKEAVAQVMADRPAYGVPTEPEEGFCGLGGRP